ncbi:Pr6Pr family membrane protein [Sphingobacterium paucimobilis]|uniref:Integral membrane protein n=1 Tax=Sphingobacterium paucimobilis HER1398 TaxID=1346330 RepID=U2HR59_9SPHI|nr:Pr6Pr family membrane protein [Sphingobacterium paucimobilis]ERJ57962.1 hypothetical protein M472_04200 [Sphingobacterium paucimobilis HER1398]
MTLSQRNLAAMIAVTAWFAIVAQFCVGINSASLSPVVRTIRFFSYFTIQTNLMVAISTTCLWLSPQKCVGVFFGKSSTLTAITLYIFIVGLVYNVALRFLWQPQGFARFTDELLHSVIPLLVLFYWWRSPEKEMLRWKYILVWLIYPLIYLLYTLAHGAITGFYPYPFVDVNALGITMVLVNCGVVGAVILLFSALLIWIGRRSKPTNV